MSEPVPVAPATKPAQTRFLAFGVVIIAFVAGVFIGVAGDRMKLMHDGRLGPPRGGERMTKFIVQRLTHELDLNSSQQSQVEHILEVHRARMRTIWGSVRPRIHQEMDGANREIESVLTPEQKQKFEKLKMRMHRRDENASD